MSLDLDNMDEDFATAEMRTRQMRRLGLVGFLPFAVLSLWLYAIADDHPWRAGTITLLSAYAAMVLSFLAGIRWGLSFERWEEDTRRALLVSLAPAAAGWIAIALPPPGSFALLAVAFAGQGAWDAFAVGSGQVPPWLGRQRNWLTLLAVAAMVLAVLATG